MKHASIAEREESGESLKKFYKFRSSERRAKLAWAIPSRDEIRRTFFGEKYSTMKSLILAQDER